MTKISLCAVTFLVQQIEDPDLRSFYRTDLMSEICQNMNLISTGRNQYKNLLLVDKNTPPYPTRHPQSNLARGTVGCVTGSGEGTVV